MKSLILIGSALSMLSSGVSAKSPQRSHVVEYDTYQVTYKYETNEVNSVNDLVIGNIYSLDCEIDDLLTTDSGYLYLSFNIVNIDILNNIGGLIDEYFTPNALFNEVGVITITSDQSDTYYYLNFPTNSGYDYYVSYYFDDLRFTGDFVLNEYTLDDLDDDNFINYTLISPCQNIPIESVEPIEHNNSLFGFVYDFVYNTILDIPNIDNYSFEVFGATTSLRQYLSISICVVLAVLFLVLLFYLIRYIFRAFSGLWS